jgi:hypothetical protein
MNTNNLIILLNLFHLPTNIGFIPISISNSPGVFFSETSFTATRNGITAQIAVRAGISSFNFLLPG